MKLRKLLIAVLCTSLLAGTLFIGQVSANNDDGIPFVIAVNNSATIDGAVEAAWDKCKATKLENTSGTVSVSGTVKAMWDEKYLYFLFEIKDPTTVAKDQPTGDKWNSDAVEIFIDERNTKIPAYNLDNNETQISIGLTNTPESIGGQNVNGYAAGVWTSTDLRAKDSKFKAVVTSTGYIIEEAIPFVIITPKVGTYIGFDVQVNDVDEASFAANKRNGMLTYGPVAGSGKADSWNDLLLSKDGTIPVAATLAPTPTAKPVVKAVVKVSKVAISKTTISLAVKKTFSLSATITPTNAANKAITWKSSNSSIASVDAKGKVTAKKKGKATITVTTTDGKKTASCVVTVK